MQLVHRSILIGAAALVLLSGCDFSSPWGSSSGGSEYGATGGSGNSGGGTGTGGTGGGGTGPVGGVGGEGGTQGTDDTVIAAPSTSPVSVAVGAQSDRHRDVQFERRTRDHGFRHFRKPRHAAGGLERSEQPSPVRWSRPVAAAF